MWVDFFRFAAFAEIGITAALLIMITYVASKVLRPVSSGGNTTGFLLWHIIAISAGLSLVVAVAADSLFNRFGESGVTWRGPVFFVGMTVTNIALVIIFRVELRRMQRKQQHKRSG